MGAPAGSARGVAPTRIFSRDLVAVHYVLRIIAAGIKPVGRIPATVVRQIIRAALHYHDGVVSKPPDSIMRSDAKMNIGPFTDSSTQAELLLGLTPISEDGRAS